MDSFRMEERTEDGDLYVTLIGELDLATAPQVDDRLSSNLEGVVGVTLDLSRLTFMDSTGLRSIYAAHHQLHGLGLSFSIVCGPVAQRLFELTSLDHEFQILDGHLSNGGGKDRPSVGP